MEKRFVNVLEKMKSEKSEDNLRDEIKSTLEEFRKVSKDDFTQLKLTMMETDKQKVENELITTKQRLVEIEDSKNSLSSQVQQLRDQLNRFETHTIQNQVVSSSSRHLPSCTSNSAIEVVGSKGKILPRIILKVDFKRKNIFYQKKQHANVV
jgi:hypothetical protein